MTRRSLKVPRSWRILPFALLGAFGLPLAPSASAQGTDLTARVDQLFQAFDRPGSPGCALGVVRDGAFVYERGYGSENLDYGRPLTSESAFYTASVSKQFTAAVIALLADQGRLGLDDDVRRYVPELPADGPTITIRQMIQHTSGLRDYLGLMNLAGMRVEDVHSDEAVFDLIVRQRHLNFAPGDEYLYSNSGYFLLSVLVERVTGMTFRQFAEASIFGPLGMASTHFHDDRTMIVPNRAMAYTPVDDGGFRVNYWANFEKVGSGGMVSSVRDLYHWDQNFFNNRLGSPQFLEAMHTRAILNSGDTIQYAFGLNIAEYRGLRTVSHGGSSMGFRAHYLQFPDERFSVILLCNVSTAVPSVLAQQIADIYLDDRFAPGSEPTRPSVASRQEEVAFDVGIAELAALAGSYHSAELQVDYLLEIRDGVLTLRRPGADRAPLRPIGEDRFMSAGNEIRFLRDFHGHPAGFDLGAGRVRSIHFQRR